MLQSDVLLLPHVRRLAALVLTVAALLAVATTAFAADGTSGGTTAGTQVKAKKVTTKQIQKALGIKADGVMGPKTRRALKRFQKCPRPQGRRRRRPGHARRRSASPARRRTARWTPPPVSDADVATVMAKIAECESGGDPTAVSPSGEYRGKYQFSQATWESLGGTGDPAEADENVQDMYAAGLYQQRGLAPWPACSQQVQAELDAPPAAPAAG